MHSIASEIPPFRLDSPIQNSPLLSESSPKSAVTKDSELPPDSPAQPESHRSASVSIERPSRRTSFSDRPSGSRSGRSGSRTPSFSLPSGESSRSGGTGEGLGLDTKGDGEDDELDAESKFYGVSPFADLLTIHLNSGGKAR